MANKKFSAFTAQAPSAINSYLVGYDAALNDNIRFQEGDLNLADMGGAINLATQTSGTIDLATQTSGTIDLATQTSGDISLTTQVTGTLPEANGGTGVTNIEDNNHVGRKIASALVWTTGLLNVPRGAEYALPFNSQVNFSTNGGVITATTSAGIAALPAVKIPAAPNFTFVRLDSSVGQEGLWRLTWKMSFYDMTADLDIQGGCYTANDSGFTTNLENHLLVKDSANEPSDSRFLEGSMFFITPPGVDKYVVPWVRFDNGSIDPYPYYDAAYSNARNEFMLQRIY